MAQIDIDRVRAETAGCEHVVHFNNAGAALMPDTVYGAVQSHLELESERGGYEAERMNQEQLAQFYTEFAAFLNCLPEEIAYVENATRAWDMAFYSIPFEPGDKILTGQSEYVSNYLALLQTAKNRGVTIQIVPDDTSGQLDVAELNNMMDERVKLISLTHVPTQGGLVNPAIEVGRIARSNNVLYLLDACQSVGQMPVDVKEIGCDMLSSTGRKYLRGPRGTGVLYVRKSLLKELEPPFVDLRSAQWHDANSYSLQNDARRFENWESFVAGRIGLTRAVQYARQIGIDSIWQRNQELAERLRDGLKRKSEIKLQDKGRQQCAIVTFTKDNESPSEIQGRMQHHRINVNVSEAASARLDFGSRNLDAVVRASVHYYNTEQEVDRFCELL